MGIESAVCGRLSVGAAHGCSLARPSRRVSLRCDLLAASPAVGRWMRVFGWRPGSQHGKISLMSDPMDEKECFLSLRRENPLCYSRVPGSDCWGQFRRQDGRVVEANPKGQVRPDGVERPDRNVQRSPMPFLWQSTGIEARFRVCSIRQVPLSLIESETTTSRVAARKRELIQWTRAKLCPV